jgi:hypothetical protein
MTGAHGPIGKSGYTWREGDAFAELHRLGDRWEVTYGFEATERSGRIVVAQRTTLEYEDAVRQLWQVIGYYFAEPEHAERVRRDLLERAQLDPGPSKYLPVPDSTYLTPAGGGAGGAEQAGAEDERRARILRGEPAPAPGAATPPDEVKKRPWWRRVGGKG